MPSPSCVISGASIAGARERPAPAEGVCWKGAAAGQPSRGSAKYSCETNPESGAIPQWEALNNNTLKGIGVSIALHRPCDDIAVLGFECHSG